MISYIYKRKHIGHLTLCTNGLAPIRLNQWWLRLLKHWCVTHVNRMYSRMCYKRCPFNKYHQNIVPYVDYRQFEIAISVSSILRCLVKNILLSEVNIWNVNCARETVFIFDARTGVLVKVSKFLSEKMSRPEGDSDIFGFMPNALTYWAIRARHLLSHVLNTGSGGIDVFK